ncbi:MAG: DUF294 nucleotidyltransferase-like domain-containing protein [Peptococcaceae bacterium]|nr:DUF294 nucleotidyltransferase-like domain-containing protein [Peptococcaceae bacterium]
MAIALREFQPFNTLPDDIIVTLSHKLVLKTFPKDTYIFNQGQSSLNYLFLVVSGLAQVILRREKGASSVVGFRHPGQFFGETVLLSDKRYPASLKAVKDLTCYLLDKESFEYLLQNYHEFAGFFSHIMADRLRDLYEEMILEQPNDIYGLRSEPFKIHLDDIMSCPIVTCSPDMPVNEIARIFAQQKISSVVVTNPNGKLLGLVTERDLISKVLALDSNPTVVHAEDIMDKNPTTLPHDSYLYQALITMIKGQGKYILATEQSRTVGIVTIGDLSKARTNSALLMVKAVDSATTIEGLRQAVMPLHKVLANMLAEKAAANEICEIVSELKDLLTRRLLTMAEEELADAGLGRPPVDYCWLALGSSGRKEQSLASDQDNAIIYADSPKMPKVDTKAYFTALAKFVIEGLAQCGIEKCPAQIMASNPVWCQPLNDWKKSCLTWLKATDATTRYACNIFLDLRTVYGRQHLADDLRQFIFRLCRIDPANLMPMVRYELEQRVLPSELQCDLDSTWSRTQRVDLKSSGSRHIVNCIRIFALREGVQETATLERINKLVQLHVLTQDDAEYYEAAFQSLMLFRLQTNLQKLAEGAKPDNRLELRGLSPRQRSVIQESFLAIGRLQSFTASYFELEQHI